MRHSKICKVDKNTGERKGAGVLVGKKKQSVLKEVVLRKEEIWEFKIWKWTFIKLSKLICTLE